MKNRDRFAKRLVSLIIAALLICTAGPVFAEGEEAASPFIDSAPSAAAVTGGQVSFLENEPKSDVKNIGFNFMDTKTRAYKWKFPYSDSFFRNGSDRFSLRHAQGSLGLALSSFKSPAGLLETNYETYLKGAGFTDLFMFGYDTPSTADSLSVIIGRKQIDDFTVIAAVACGQGYGKEWAGNMKVGDSVRHEGFNSAAKQFEDHLDRYIDDNNIKGKKKLWLTGFSRAAAVANITAADMAERGEFDDIYAYLFGVPRTTKEPVAYKGIYNICGQYDPVTDTPFQSWGYERYGTDLFTPAQESDPNYGEHEAAAANVGDRMGSDGFRNNPEVNYQLHLILETLAEMFDSSKEYSDRLQDLMVNAMLNRGSSDGLTDVLADAIVEFVPKNSRERQEKTVILDYLSYITAQHMRARQRQIEYGSWKPDESLAANLVIEHRPVTYAKWLFSADDPRELFSNSTESRRVAVIGDVDVAVYRDGRGITAISRKGRISLPEGETENPDDGIAGIFVMRNGHQTVVNLPDDADFEMVVTAPKKCDVIIYDILVSARKLQPEAGQLYLGDIPAGQHRFSVKAGSSPVMQSETGAEEHRLRFVNTRYNYSPTAVMGDELAATADSHLSLSTALLLVMAIMAGAFLLLVICLIIYGVHRYKVKKGHAPYSDWYVIAPHLIVITVSAVMTQFATFFLYPVGRARAVCAAITMFYIFLLALRGTIRSRNPKQLLIPGFILVCAGLSALYYNRLPISTFSIPNMIAFFIMIALLSALAVRAFRRNNQEETLNMQSEISGKI